MRRWATAKTLHASLTTSALKMALKHRHPPTGLLHHSDRGVQYASGEHRALPTAAGMAPSMSRAGKRSRVLLC